MICVGCGGWGGDLCARCRASLVEAPDRRLRSGLLVRSAFAHGAVARQIVHAFKYRGSDRAGWLLARAMAPLAHPTATLVPLPRAGWRTISYGLDPATDLARRIGRLTGAGVWPGLRPPLQRPAQAGKSRTIRQPPVFTMGPTAPPHHLILVDDVVTTGRTLSSAHELLKPHGPLIEALTATAADD